MWRIIASLFVLASCVLLAACGGSMSQSSTSPSPVSNGVPMSLTIGDAPPSGVAVLFFEASITGASLQPSDTSKPPVPVLSTPVEVEFGHLQTDTAFLNLANVTPDTYQSMTLTFANAVMTIVNHSGATIGSCGNNSVCELTPNFNPSAATVSSSPFPLTIGQNSVVGIQLDFNVDASVQSDLSISPAVTIKQLTQRQDSDENQEMAELDDVDGLVTAIGTNQFTLTNERSGQSFTISVDSNTRFQDFDGAGCTANPANLTCLQAGAIVSVDLSENGSGTMLAKSVEFEANANQQAIKGIITSVDSATQYHMVVFNEEPTVNGIAEGTAVVVAIQPNAVFLVGRDEMDEEHGFSMPDLLFTSSADLLVGQDVQIQPGTITSSGGINTISTDLVRLWPSQITGQVGSIDSSNGTFTLTGLSPLFTGATPPVTTITVVTLPEMEFMDLSGLSSLAVGNTVSVRGLLFNTPGTPTLVTRRMREHEGEGEGD